jgi:hypothetical protein
MSIEDIKPGDARGRPTHSERTGGHLMAIVIPPEQGRKNSLALAALIGLDLSQVQPDSLCFETNYWGDGRTRVTWEGIAAVRDEEIFAIWNEGI